MSPTAAPESSRTEEDYLSAEFHGEGTETVTLDLGALNLGILAAGSHACGGSQRPDVPPFSRRAPSMLGATTRIPLPGEHDFILCLGEWPRQVPAGAEPSWGEKWESEIERARTILDLEEDWDGEGTMPYARETFERAVSFASGLLRTMSEHTSGVIVPVIGPGPDGSVDLHWKTRDLEMLVNITADPGSKASYYGDDYGDFTFEGTLDPGESNNIIAAWLSAPQEIAA